MRSVPVEYRQSMDLARFIAAFGIVASHLLADPRDWLGHLSLGLFLTLTAVLAVQSVERSDGRYQWQPRLKRLLLPWLFWSLVYRIVDMRVSDSPDRFTLLTDPWSLLVGPSIHLWFLPFLMLAVVLVTPACRWITTPFALAVASLGLVLAGVPLFYIHQSAGLPAPLAQWTFALPLFSYGLLVGLGHRLERPAYPMIAMIVLTVLAYPLTGEPWEAQGLLAAAAFSFFWHLSLHHRALPALGKAAFGIYLMHPFFLLVLHKFGGLTLGFVPALLITFAMSWAATMIALRIPYLRRVV